MRSGCSAGLILTLALAGAGCGGSSKTVAVEGVVTLDGNPLADATVSFTPQDPGGQPASGRSRADGSFQLTTFQPNDGALPGNYKIVVTKSEMLSPPAAGGPVEEKQFTEMMNKMMLPQKGKKGAAKSKSLVPAQYQSEAKTPLRARIPQNGKVQVDLKSGPET